MVGTALAALTVVLAFAFGLAFLWLLRLANLFGFDLAAADVAAASCLAASSFL